MKSRISSTRRTQQLNSTMRCGNRANARIERRSDSMMSAPSASFLIILQVVVLASVSAADAVLPLLREDIHSSPPHRDHIQLGHHARGLVESYTGHCFASQTTYCQDNPRYQTLKGVPCSFHAELISTSDGENCFHEWLLGTSWFSELYDQDQIFELVWECPCACNVQCHEGDKQEFDDEDIGEIDLPPSFHFGIANDTDTYTAPPTPAPTDHSFTTGGFGEIGVPAEALNRPEDEVDTMSVITPAVSAEGSDLSPSSPSDGSGILSQSNAFVLIAVIAAACVVVAVVLISVIPLIRNARKAREDDDVISAASIDRTDTTKVVVSRQIEDGEDSFDDDNVVEVELQN